MKSVNVVNVSGGKDSTATALVACDQAEGDIRFVFADTGHEHWRTYEYLEYLDRELRERVGVGITRVRADFSDRMKYRREHLQERWEAEGVPQERIDQAMSVMQPTGNPMLDLCLLRGRFPSQKARFCTQELKVFPVQKQIVQPLAEDYEAVIMWHGVRRDESSSRAMLEPRSVELGQWEPKPQGILIYRPVLEWTPDDVFAKHREAGVRWNPLYEEGMGRVGCAPCIHARKAELGEWARRYPEIFDHLAYMEERVSEASKRGVSTFFAQDKTPGDPNDWTRSSAYKVKEWATHGGQDRLFDLDETGAIACTSVYGLCE